MVEVEFQKYEESSFKGKDGKTINYIIVDTVAEWGDMEFTAYKRDIMDYIRSLKEGDKFSVKYQKSGNSHKITEIGGAPETTQEKPATAPQKTYTKSETPPIVSNMMANIIPALVNNGVIQDWEQLEHGMAIVGKWGWLLSHGAVEEVKEIEKEEKEEEKPKKKERKPASDEDIPF